MYLLITTECKFEPKILRSCFAALAFESNTLTSTPKKFYVKRDMRRFDLEKFSEDAMSNSSNFVQEINTSPPLKIISIPF